MAQLSSVTMIPVSRSNVAAVGYSDEDQELFVQYSNGATYRYDNVTTEEYSGLTAAVSVGKYLNTNIKPYKDYEQVA